MNHSEWLAMRGFLDVVLLGLLVSRFASSAVAGSRRLLFLQLFLLSLIITVLQLLGLWSWAELRAAASLLPVVWPLLLVIGYLFYSRERVAREYQKIAFELAWRKEHQEVIEEELEKRGWKLPEKSSEHVGTFSVNERLNKHSKSRSL